MGIRRGTDDTMHIMIDGEDMGPAATGVAKVDPKVAFDSGSGVEVFHSSPIPWPWCGRKAKLLGLPM